MHDVVIVGIPLLAVFTGILFNRADAKNCVRKLLRWIGKSTSRGLICGWKSRNREAGS